MSLLYIVNQYRVYIPTVIMGYIFIYIQLFDAYTGVQYIDRELYHWCSMCIIRCQQRVWILLQTVTFRHEYKGNIFNGSGWRLDFISWYVA
jgi:hypothetical protein